MNCAQVKEQLIDFLYEELSAPARASFEDHLRGCPGCSDEVASHRKALGQTRTALTGPLLQDPPPHLRLTIMDAAKQAAKTAQKTAQRASSKDEPGFFARLWRTPWLMTAFGAASVATVVLLVRVLKDPEIVPGQEPHSIEESAPAAPEAVLPPTPSPLPLVEKKAEADKRVERPLGLVAPARSRAAVDQDIGKMGPKESHRKMKGGARDPFADSGTLSGGTGVPGSGRYAEPPPARSARPTGGKDLDDLLRAPKDDRYARPPAEAQPAQPKLGEERGSADKDLGYGKPPVIAKQAAAKKSAAAPPLAAEPETAALAPGPTAKVRREIGLAPAAPPPPPSAVAASTAPAAAPAPVYAAPPSNAPRRTDSKSEAAEATAALEPEERERSKEKASAGSGKGGSSVEESAKKADRLFVEEQWGAAAAAYRDLLNRYPGHKEASKWRERLNQSIVAEQEARNRSSKAAKAKSVDEVLKGSK